MKTLFVLAASALALTTASSAFAGEQVVKVRGRTDAAVHADIVSAASSICREDLGGHANDLYAYCVREVTRDAVLKIGTPSLKAYDRHAFRAGGLQKISY
ncbi:hypothetical protein ASD21_00705 [Caulobacter sp. Root1455]|jgi:hypothetical protein|uniref:hypothetical protein n=1 Tax=unclassified Caulobacter TaxID=2648921 RepID=UPI0006FE3F24|nr:MULTISPECIES: hypothetical protein [unclassified Caulobacter]KQY35840.1 hypothetical protein ASD38_04635 [Caulobacter sp. Root487D2Y]KQZ06194.1 hypothetical protein ASD21_00705 [Caulobacter sp. Root1455]